MKISVVVFLNLCLILFSTLQSEDTVCKVLKDNSIAAHSSELYENTGRSKLIKIKGNQNYPIFQFDLSGVPKDAIVEHAFLSITVISPVFKLKQIGFSNLPVDWAEGQNAKPDNKTHKFACYNGSHGGSGWGAKGMSFHDVTFGNRGSVTGVTLAKRVKDTFIIKIDGRVINAIRSNPKSGLAICDESGWWPSKESNVFFHSRESKGKHPSLKVIWKKNTDKISPGEPQVKNVTGIAEEGEVLIDIISSGNDGVKGIALGYELRIGEGKNIAWDKLKNFGGYRTPRPRISGESKKLLLDNLKPGATYTISLQASDEAGNKSKVVSLVTSAGAKVLLEKPDVKKLTFETGGELVAADIAKIYAVDELTKIDPVSGMALLGKGYRKHELNKGNFLWNGKSKSITFDAAKGETVACRIVVSNIKNKITSAKFKLNDLKMGKNIVPSKWMRILRPWYQKVDGKYYSAALPDITSDGKGFIGIPDANNNVAGQTNQTFYFELFVPKDAVAGTYKGTVDLIADGKTIPVPVDLNVRKITMPSELNFIIELNAYGQRNKSRWFATHRLAHRFRTGYNALEYGHSGSSSVKFVPAIEGKGKEAKIVSWKVWDEWMESLLNGSLFKDLPRGAVPIPHYYMPFYENYPASIWEYLGGKIHEKRKGMNQKDKVAVNKYRDFLCSNDVLVWDGFSELWKDQVRAIGKQYREHFEKKGWTKTQFQLFLNNKIFKGGKFATSLWTLDEPTYARDFRAIGWIYHLFKEPFKGSSVEFVTRADVSRPETQGDKLDNAVDIYVVSRAFYEYYRDIEKRFKEQNCSYWGYGGGGNLASDSDLTQLVAYYVKIWTMGGKGGLAFWTSFSGATWDEKNSLGIVLKRAHGYKNLAIATGRLAAERRAQQDIELMILLSKRKGWSKQKVVKLVSTIINLASKTSGDSDPDDPGNISFKGVSADISYRLRLVLFEKLEK